MPSKPTKLISALSLAELAEQRGYKVEPCTRRKGSYFLWKNEVAAQNPEREWLPYFTEREARRFLAKIPKVAKMSKSAKLTVIAELAELATARGYTLEVSGSGRAYTLRDRDHAFLQNPKRDNLPYWSEEEARAFLQGDAEPIRTSAAPPVLQRLYEKVVARKKKG